MRKWKLYQPIKYSWGNLIVQADIIFIRFNPCTEVAINTNPQTVHLFWSTQGLQIEMAPSKWPREFWILMIEIEMELLIAFKLFQWLSMHTNLSTEFFHLQELILKAISKFWTEMEMEELPSRIWKIFAINTSPKKYDFANPIQTKWSTISLFQNIHD